LIKSPAKLSVTRAARRFKFLDLVGFRDITAHVVSPYPAILDTKTAKLLNSQIMQQMMERKLLSDKTSDFKAVKTPKAKPKFSN